MAVALSGRIGAGKTTVAECLGQRLGAPVVGFGDAVRAEAARRGLAPTRESLQDLGQSMLDALGPTAFSLRAMHEAGVGPSDLPMIIEGVRHVAIYDALSSLVAPNPMFLIYVDTPDQMRRERLAASGVEADQIPSMDSHATELDVVMNLRALADYVVTNDETEATCQQVVRWLEAKSD